MIIRPYGARAPYVWCEEYPLAFWLFCPFLFLDFWFYKQKGSNNYTQYFLKHNTLPDISQESPNRHLLSGGHFPPWAPAEFLSTPFPLLPLPASVCSHCSAFMRSSLRQGRHPSAFMPQSCTNTRHRKNPLGISGLGLPALELLPWVVSSQAFQSPSVSPLSLSSCPCNTIWKILVCNLYFRSGSMWVFAYPDTSSYCLLNQRAVNQGGPQQ